MKKKFQQKNRAFTLVETMVAISIFTMSILGLMSVLTQGISNSNYAKQKMIASYLAQEGIEYVRNMRDTFVLYDTDPTNPSQHGWDAFKSYVTAKCPAGTGCTFGDLSSADYTNVNQPMAGLAVTSCGGTCPPLLYKASTGKYSYDVAGVDVGIVRKINIETISADETKISSTVSWRQGSGVYSIVFSERLFNWIQ